MLPNRFKKKNDLKTVTRLFALKDHFQESRLFLNRTITATIFVIVLLSLLLLRLVYLQIFEYDRYKTLSLNNQVRVVPTAPARGFIYDRNGVILADNVPAFSLEITPERVDDLGQTLTKLQDIGLISEDNKQNFSKQLKYKRRSDNIPIRMQLTEEELAKFALEKHTLQGVEITARLIRRYPLGYDFAHALGYIGPISEKELEEIDEDTYRGLYYIGKTGLEKSYESELKGKVGYQHIETDARGRTIRILKQIPSVKGADLQVSLDSRLQRKAYEAMGEYKGALVAIDPKTGEILALVSQPSFDPNLFVQGISVADYRGLQDSPYRPLFNRAVRGQYPPGSTIKPLIALQALDIGTINSKFGIFDPGYYQLHGKGRLYRDWIFHSKRHGHGWVDLENAISQSCDTYFFTISQKLGIHHLQDIFHRFGLGSLTGIDIPSEAAGIVPCPQWKQKMKKEQWFEGDTLNVSIGQGMMLSTPLQLAHMTSLIAQKGLSFQPHIVQKIMPTIEKMDESGETPATEPNYHLVPQVHLSQPKHWDTVIDAMQKVVHSPCGTAFRAASGITYQMAGKTGTAQVFSLKQNEKYEANRLKESLRDHSWFIGFAPIDDPQIAVAVIVENKLTKTGAHVAREFLDSFFENQKKDNKQALKPLLQSSQPKTAPVSETALGEAAVGDESHVH